MSLRLLLLLMLVVTISIVELEMIQLTHIAAMGCGASAAQRAANAETSGVTGSAIGESTVFLGELSYIRM